MITKTILALSLFTGTVTLTNYSQTSEREVTNLNPPQILTQLPTTELETIAQNITVQVRMGEDRGSGILIAKDNDTYTVITNAHVTDRGETYRIQTPDGMEHEATLVNSTEQNDLAVLEFNSSNSYQVATVGNSDSITEGETALAAGFPDGKENLLVSEGKITTITAKPLEKGYSLGFTNETVQGMSGGVLLNSNGEVIAVLGKGKNAILDTAYDYIDGTKPTAAEIASYKQVSFSIPIANIANLSPQLAALVPGENNPDIAQQPEIEETPTPKPKYTGIVKTVDDIAEQITVRIDNLDKNANGSGVIIAKQDNTYYVATAGHVVDENGSYQIVTPDGATHELDNQTIEESDAYDFAIFSFTSEKDYTVATIGNYTVAANSDRFVFVSGFSKNQSPQRIITGGWVKRNSLIAKDFYSLQDIGRGLLYSNLSYGGMSGGAVLDSEGRLIGINTGAENEFYDDEAGNYEEFSVGFGLGIPIRDVFSFLHAETSLKLEWLQITKNSALDINGSEYLDIETQLLTAKQPEDESNIAAWMNYGNQLWRYERFKEAEDAFDRVIAIAPEFDKAYYTMSLSYLYQGEWQQAANVLLKATQINSNPYYYWRYLGSSYVGLEQYGEAISAYDKALENNQIESTKDFVLYLERADALSRNQNLMQAITSYNEAIEINSQHPYIYNNRGNTYYLLQQYESALADFNQAIELDPLYAGAYYNRGVLYNDLGQYEQALGDYTQAIEIEPLYAGAYNNRGILYNDLEQHELALKDYNKAIELDPEYAIAYINRGLTYGDLEQYEQALADYNKAIELNVSNPEEAYYYRGTVYGDLQQYEQALADHNKAIEINQQYAPAYLGLGVVYLRTENIEEAKINLEKARQLYISQTNTAGAESIDNILKQLP